MGENENLGCLGALFGIFGSSESAASASSDTELPYRLRDDFLSPAERSFFTVLVSAVGDDVSICPKVNLADIFFVSKPNENKGARGRISQKHLDFLVCDSRTMQPLVGVELDDSSHSRPDRQARDGFIDQVFAVARLPLVHVPVQAGYSVPAIQAQLSEHLAGRSRAASSEPTSPVVSPGEAPNCPKCGTTMVLRTASRGDVRGSQFYGCPNYPKCRSTLPVGEA